MLLGTYERAGVPWSPKTTPWDFGQDLLPNDLERIAPSVSVAFEHFPRLESAGIKKVVNGPFTFAPDGNPLDRPGQGPEELLGGLRRHGRASARAAAWACRSRTGWSKAIRAPTSGRWTSRATATGPTVRTRTPRCARTTRGASASASRTRNSRLRARCAPRRSTRSCRPRTPCSATTARSSIRCGLRRRARRRRKMRRSVARTHIRTWPRNAARCANPAA